MNSPFRAKRRIEFADTDMAGIVHFSNFFRLMESAEVEFLRERGLCVALEWEGKQMGFPRVSASCDYFKPVRFQDIVEIEVSISRLGQRSVSYTFDFYKGNEKVAHGKVTAVCCSVLPNSEIEAIDIPPSMRRLLE